MKTTTTTLFSSSTPLSPVLFLPKSVLPKPSSAIGSCSSLHVRVRRNTLSVGEIPSCSVEVKVFDSSSRSSSSATTSARVSSGGAGGSWWSHLLLRHGGLAAAALSLALTLCPALALASEFDVLNDGPPKETYLLDDANVLSRVTKSDLKQLLSDLEARKGIRLNFITVRKLTSKADAFEYADQILERWYPTIEEGNNKGIVVLVTSQKEGAVTGGPKFIQSVGETVLDATVSENLPVLAMDEKYNEAILSSAMRLVASIDGLPDPGGPKFKDSKRESNFKTREETEEKRGQFSLVVGGLLVIAFVVPMAQYYAYVSKK